MLICLTFSWLFKGIDVPFISPGPFLALRFSYSYSVFDNSVIFCLSLIFFEYYLALVY